MKSIDKKKQKNNAPILNTISDFLSQSKSKDSMQQQSVINIFYYLSYQPKDQDLKKNRIKTNTTPKNRELVGFKPNDFNIEDSMEFQIIRSKYQALIASVQSLFLMVNKKYFQYEQEDLQEKFKRRQDEFAYERIDAVQLVELSKEMIEIFCRYQIDTENVVQDYKLLQNKDEEAKDYILLLQKSERDMRQAIRENQQLKMQIDNLKLKIQSNEKQIELLTQYTQKAMEEMKGEFTFAIELLADRERNLHILKEELKRKGDVIRSLDEQLISILILEHKIGYMGQKAMKDKDKLSVEWQEKLKMNERQLKEQLRKDNQEKEKKIQQLEQSLKQTIKDKEYASKELNVKKDILNISIRQNQRE